MMRTHWAALALVVLGTASCSSKSSAGGAKGGTGGTAGSDGGGVDGAADGAAGSGGLPPSCTDDPDCDDKLACNGDEKCQAGKCVAGTPVDCPNPDAAHCVGECKEAGGGNSTCVVTGKDGDGDTHLDMACTGSSSAADDCDDNNKDVYPGASEVCDGLDNDCDGKDELDDGVPPTGTTADFIKGSIDANHPAIAWSPTSMQYGVVWVDDSIRYVGMSPDGTMLGSPVQVSTHITQPRIAWNGTHFGVTWTHLGRVHFRRVTPDGKFPDAAVFVSDASSKAGNPDIAAAGSGWAAIWSDTRTNTFGTLYARAIGAGGTVTGTDSQVGTSGGSNQGPVIASDGSGLLVARERGAASSPNLIQVFNMTPTLAVSGEKAVSADPPPSGTKAVRPVVAATDNGWALAWRETMAASDNVRYYEQLASGAAGCSSPLGIPASPTGFPGAVAARGASRVVVFGESASLTAKVQLVRLKSGCASPVTYKISDADVPDWVGFGVPVAAWSDSSLAVLWVDQSSGTTVIRRWVSGPNLCDNVKP